MFKSPLLRRVGIYLVLSTAAVTVVNQLEIEQQSAYQIYIPMFIGIYVISRWIDSRFNQAPPKQQLGLLELPLFMSQLRASIAA